MKIIIVCGAGASSTFVANRVRRAARERDLEAEVVATSEDRLVGALPGADVILLGHHLAARRDEFAARAATSAAVVAVMPESVFTSPAGDLALDLALHSIAR